ncbi:MAG: ABC transporter permease subunit, partial [Bifidobacteriaceae bacterium]|nr:ABC transporter permease subunit [Bifidobacteriaceae bacterium]
YRRSFPGRAVVRVLITAPFALPAVVVGLAFRSLLGSGGPLAFLGLDGSFLAVVLALGFFNLGLMTRILGTFWQALDPRPEQAARLLGASPFRALIWVSLPAVAPALAAGGAMVFLFCTTAFSTVLIIGGPAYGTVETEIWRQTTQLLNLRAAAVLSVVQVVLVTGGLLASSAARRRRERALKLTGAGRAAALPCPPLTKADWPPAAVTGLAALAIATPLATLVARSLRTAHGTGLDNYRALASGAMRGLPYSVLQAAGTSVRIALVATGVALALGLAISVVLSRRAAGPWGRRLQGFLDSVFMLPLGVSAVTVGFGFLITLDTPPFNLRTSFWLIPLAQALVALPMVMRSMLPVLRAIDPRQRQAAQALGASPWRTFWAVDTPVLARPAAVGAAYAFAVSLGEFGATSFLVRPETTTLPVAIYRLLGRPGITNLGAALAGAVLLAAVTCGIMAAAELARGTKEGGEL